MIVILSSVYIRFFRSFNFDYLRQDKDGVDRFPWDGLATEPDAFYPFVKVDLEEDITSVVGANEAGKSQLITAIQCLLGDKSITPRDFCRYSTFFGVTGRLPLPEFGGRFTSLTPSDRGNLAAAGIADTDAIDEYWVFRFSSGPALFHRAGDQFVRTPLDDYILSLLQLPVARRINADIALPASVSLYDLQSAASAPHPRDRVAWHQIHAELKSNEDNYAAGAMHLTQLLQPLASPSPRDAEAAARSLSLARDLFEKVADIDPATYGELLQSGGTDDGYSAALTESMTDSIATALNFQQWWTQDKDFALEVHRDGFYLVLTMRDRTGQRYTFDERSGGMKYFLSYFIQYKAYEPNQPGRSEILLMDEPDAYLSTQGQQDLLQILESYAHPEGDAPAVQVLYVTHSPFLIDKNHPERIRVLQKGFGDEGTRIVAKAATEKYEPLRSAFGSFHADTAFIGSCNLLVEGPADLVLFSGVSAAMRRHSFRGPNLDLNTLTLVPVHGASQYRYTLHLTRGRDLDRPAVVVLLDSDLAGEAAQRDLEKGYGTSPIVDAQLIFAIGELNHELLTLGVNELHEPEDLVPAAAALQVVSRFAKEVLPPEHAGKVVAALPKTFPKTATERLYDRVKEVARKASEQLERPLDIGKIEFARTLASVIDDLDETTRQNLFDNFAALFEQLNLRQDTALRLSNQDRLSDITRRLVERFRRDHRTRAQKHTVTRFLNEVEQHLEGAGQEEELIRHVVRSLRHDFALESEPLSDVQDFTALKSRLKDLIYSPTRTLESSSLGIDA